MDAPCPMPCHITRLLAAPALITVAATAATPSLPTIGSFWVPRSSTGNFKSFGSGGVVPLGQLRQFTISSAPTVPNCGYSLPHATTSSRTRSGVGRFSESLQPLTNWPSVLRSVSASLIRLLSALQSPERAPATAVARLFVAAAPSPRGYASVVAIASATVATERELVEPDPRTWFSSASTAPL